MKVKKFNNLWTMGIILCCAILFVIYVAKIFFPELVVEIAQIESITKIGSYIDIHKWAWYLATTIMTFASYYLICCACCGKKKLSTKECLIVLATILVLYFVQEFLPDQYTVLNIISLILLPYLFKGDFKKTLVVFSTTNLLQTITLTVRNIQLMIINYNYASFMILTIDFYILCGLLYCLYNFKKGE
jgi:hypothetical protein